MAADAAPSSLGEIRNRDDRGPAHVLAGVQYLRSNDPIVQPPTWSPADCDGGELRAAGPAPDPKALAAAPFELRMQIKALALEGKWLELLEACERRIVHDMRARLVGYAALFDSRLRRIGRAVSASRARSQVRACAPSSSIIRNFRRCSLWTIRRPPIWRRRNWLRTKVLNSDRLLNPLPEAQNGNGGVYERALEAATAGNARGSDRNADPGACAKRFGAAAGSCEGWNWRSC